MHFAFCIIIFADVAERQTRWFQVPVKRFVWVQIPSSAPSKYNSSLSRVVFALDGIWRGAVVNDSPGDYQSRDWPTSAVREETKSRHPHQQNRYNPCGCAFFVYKGGGIWNREKIAIAICPKDRTVNNCSSAKAATGGNRVVLVYLHYSWDATLES